MGLFLTLIFFSFYDCLKMLSFKIVYVDLQFFLVFLLDFVFVLFFLHLFLDLIDLFPRFF